MNSAAARNGRRAPLAELPPSRVHADQSRASAADQAELDVLLWALATGFEKHRERCRACQPGPCPELEALCSHKAACHVCRGDAPLTFGWRCAVREQLLDEHRDCPRCNTCRSLERAISEVLDWRHARALLTRAEALRAEQRRLAAV